MLTGWHVGIAADHGGFALKQDLVPRLRGAGYDTVDLGATVLNPDDDYPDFTIPLAKAVAGGLIKRGIAICGTGVGASVWANKIAGVRAALIHDTFSARQGVEDDHVNFVCLGGQTIGASLAWELIKAFLEARFSRADRPLGRLQQLTSLERQGERYEYRALR